MHLDPIHLAMLARLREDGRLSVSALAEEVGISRANAHTRLEALQESGVIRRFTVDLDPAGIAKPLAALVFVSLHQTQWADFRSRLRDLPGLQYFAVTTGQFDGMLLVRASDVSAVHHLVVSVIAHWPSVRATETVFLMDEEHFDDDLAATPVPANETLGMTRFTATPDRRGR